MAERYKPTGTPLSEYERELLTILIEEAAEVQQAATKLLRFGKEAYEGYGDNQTVMAHEVGDLTEMIEMAIRCKLLDERHIDEGQARKHERLKFYMLNAEPV